MYVLDTTVKYSVVNALFLLIDYASPSACSGLTLRVMARMSAAGQTGLSNKLLNYLGVQEHLRLFYSMSSLSNWMIFLWISGWYHLVVVPSPPQLDLPQMCLIDSLLCQADTSP